MTALSSVARRIWRRRRGVELRTVVAAAVITALLLGLGAGWVRHLVAANARAATVEQARSQVDLLLNLLLSGSSFGGDFGPLPYEIVAGNGIVVASSSQFQGLERQGPVFPAPGQGGSEALYRTWTHDFGTGGPLAGVLDAVDGTIAAPVGASFPEAFLPQVRPGDRIRVYVVVTPTQVRASLASVDPYLAVGIPLGVMLVAAVAGASVRRSLHAVEAIRSRTAEVNASDPRQRVDVPATGDEIQALAETINVTLDRLERAAAAQRRFVADAAHELRSPLAAMMTTLDVAATYPHADPGDVQARVLRSAVRLSDLVEHLLVLARLDAGAPTRTEWLDLADVVAEAVAVPVARVPVRAEVADSVPVRGDHQQLVRIVRNLLDNAIRHADGAVEIGCRRYAGRAILEVHDDGAGIPAAERERVFDRFTRLDEARNRDQGGTGLGLAIARELAATHHGTLTLSRSTTSGTTFVLELPLADPARPQPASEVK